jgi:hypothetical protein
MKIIMLITLISLILFFAQQGRREKAVHAADQADAGGEGSIWAVATDTKRRLAD